MVLKKVMCEDACLDTLLEQASHFGSSALTIFAQLRGPITTRHAPVRSVERNELGINP